MTKLRHREVMGNIELSVSQRKKIADSVFAALDDKGQMNHFIGEVEAALEWYAGDIEAGLNDRLSDKKQMERELAALGAAAKILSDCLNGITSEARDRMIGPDDFECGRRIRNERLTPERLFAPMSPCLSIAKRSQDAILELRRENRGTRPRDVAAHRLVLRLSSPWQAYTSGKMEREARDGTPSTWVCFVKTVLAVAGADVKGDRLARTVAGQWPRADKS